MKIGQKPELPSAVAQAAGPAKPPARSGAAAAGASGMDWAFGFFGHGALLVWMMASEMIESGLV